MIAPHVPPNLNMGVSQQIGLSFFGVYIIRTEVLWGLYWGPPIEGNYHINLASSLPKKP